MGGGDRGGRCVLRPAGVDLLARLAAGGYERTDLVRVSGEMAVRGGLLDVFPSTEDRPVRIEWSGDEIESVRAFDPDTQRTVEALEAVTVLVWMPVSVLVATTLTFGTAAPLGSVTVPRMLPYRLSPNAGCTASKTASRPTTPKLMNAKSLEFRTSCFIFCFLLSTGRRNTCLRNLRRET
jgi:hypothetical protein